MMEHVHDSWWKGLRVLEGTGSPGSLPAECPHFSSPSRCSAESKLKICKACWWGWELWALGARWATVSHCEPARLGGEVKALRLFHQFFDDFQKIGLDFATLGGSSLAMFFTFCFSMGWSLWFTMCLEQPFLVVPGAQGPPGSQPQGLSVWITLRPSSGLCAFRWVGTPKTTERTKFIDGAFEGLGSTKTGYFVESMWCMYVSLIIYIYIYILFLYSTVLHYRKLKVYFTKCPNYVGCPKVWKERLPRETPRPCWRSRRGWKGTFFFSRLTWPAKWDISDLPPFFRHTNII